MASSSTEGLLPADGNLTSYDQREDGNMMEMVEIVVDRAKNELNETGRNILADVSQSIDDSLEQVNHAKNDTLDQLNRAKNDTLAQVNQVRHNTLMQVNRAAQAVQAVQAVQAAQPLQPVQAQAAQPAICACVQNNSCPCKGTFSLSSLLSWIRRRNGRRIVICSCIRDDCSPGPGGQNCTCRNPRLNATESCKCCPGRNSLIFSRAITCIGMILLLMTSIYLSINTNAILRDDQDQDFQRNSWKAILCGIILAIVTFVLPFTWVILQELNIIKHQTIVPRLGIILGLLAFVMVWYYYDNVAVHRRAAWRFEVDVTHPDTLPSPAFVIAIGYGDAAFAQFRRAPHSGILTKCFWPEYDKSCPTNFSDVIKSFNSSIYGQLWYLSYRPNSTREEYSNLSQKHILQVFTSWDSASISYHYNTTAPQLPYYYYAIFDSNLDFEKGLECGLITLREMPAIGSNSFAITASYYDDALNVLYPNSSSSACAELGHHLYQFDTSLSSTGGYNYTACDANEQEACISQILIRYASPYVQSFTTVQGRSAADILTDEGGIVGGVAFLSWLFTVIDQLW